MGWMARLVRCNVGVFADPGVAWRHRTDTAGEIGGGNEAGIAGMFATDAR